MDLGEIRTQTEIQQFDICRKNELSETVYLLWYYPAL